MTFPNEIEKTKAEIKVLEAKLSLLEELKKQKSPVEIAFKDSYGVYPDELKTTDDFNCWNSFRRGYIAAKQEKVSEYQPTPQTPEQVAEGLRDAMKTAKAQGVFDEPEPKIIYEIAVKWCDDEDNPPVSVLIDRIEKILPAAISDLSCWDGVWSSGFNLYREMLMEKLR